MNFSRESLDKQTPGKPVRSFQQYFSINHDLAIQLSEALNLRNTLMHGYFPRNARRMQSEAGSEEMIAELKGDVETLWNATRIVAPFVSEEAEQVILLLKERALPWEQSQ